MSAQHSGPPWNIRRVHPDNLTREVWSDAEGRPYLVAVLSGPYKDGNAALVSAAPALLAALEGLSDKVLVYQADGYNQDTYRQMGKANEAARQAIRQARGKEAAS